MKGIFATLAFIALVVATPARRLTIEDVTLWVYPGNKYGTSGQIGEFSAAIFDSTFKIPTSTLSPSFKTAEYARVVTNLTQFGLKGCTAFANSDCTGTNLTFGNTKTDMSVFKRSIGCYLCA